MDNNTQIENLPAGVRIENSDVSAEFETKTEATEASPVVPATAVSPQAETVAEPAEKPVGVEINTKTSKPSAGFPIESESTGAARIVLDKLIDRLANL